MVVDWAGDHGKDVPVGVVAHFTCTEGYACFWSVCSTALLHANASVSDIGVDLPWVPTWFQSLTACFSVFTWSSRGPIAGVATTLLKLAVHPSLQCLRAEVTAGLPFRTRTSAANARLLAGDKKTNKQTNMCDHPSILEQRIFSMNAVSMDAVHPTARPKCRLSRSSHVIVACTPPTNVGGTARCSLV